MKSHSNSYDPAYRQGVGIMLLNQHSLVFVGQRFDSEFDAWQMPQGGIDPGEDPSAAMYRELEEEVGTAKVELIAESKQWLKYDLPEKLKASFWGGKYQGQQQKWYLVRLKGGDELININTPHPEFKAYKWVEPMLLPEMIVPFKRELYKAILSEFSSYL